MITTNGATCREGRMGFRPVVQRDPVTPSRGPKSVDFGQFGANLSMIFREILFTRLQMLPNLHKNKVKNEKKAQEEDKEL